MKKRATRIIPIVPILIKSEMWTLDGYESDDE